MSFDVLAGLRSLTGAAASVARGAEAEIGRLREQNTRLASKVAALEAEVRRLQSDALERARSPRRPYRSVVTDAAVAHRLTQLRTVVAEARTIEEARADVARLLAT